MTPIDLTPLINGVVVPILTPVILALAGWALKRVAGYAHIQVQDAQRRIVEEAIRNGIAYATKTVGPVKVDAPESIGAAVNYVLPKVPGAMKSLGLTPEGIQSRIIARLPE